jgi:hypothetical protein
LVRNRPDLGLKNRPYLTGEVNSTGTNAHVLLPGLGTIQIGAGHTITDDGQLVFEAGRLDPGGSPALCVALAAEFEQRLHVRACDRVSLLVRGEAMPAQSPSHVQRVGSRCRSSSNIPNVANSDATDTTNVQAQSRRVVMT